MLFKFLFCCSNSTLKENKTITFEEKDNNIVNGTIPPYVNMNKHREKNKKDEIAHKEIKKESKNKDRSLNHKKKQLQYCSK